MRPSFLDVDVDELLGRARFSRFAGFLGAYDSIKVAARSWPISPRTAQERVSRRLTLSGLGFDLQGHLSPAADSRRTIQVSRSAQVACTIANGSAGGP